MEINDFFRSYLFGSKDFLIYDYVLASTSQLD